MFKTKINFHFILIYVIPGVTTRSSKSSSTFYSSSSGSVISTSYLEEVIDELKYQQHAKSTDINYHGIWTLFNQFFIKLDRKPEKLEDRLALFGAYLVKTEKQSPTIKLYFSAVRSVLSAAGIELNLDHSHLSALVKACKVRNDRLFVRLPLQKSLLQVMLE